MSKTFTYTFSTPANSSITVVTSDTAQNISGAFGTTGFPIQSISGTFNGENIAGLYGASGQEQNDSNTDDQDNTITSSITGNQAAVDGIDQFGISFTTTSGKLYTLESNVGGGLFIRSYASTSSTSSTSPATLSSTNYDSVACFRSGSRISTARGEMAVEALGLGDLVVTASGAQRPVRWLGHRTIDCRHDPEATHPVRISAHAFGENRPSRDLYVSPGHAICVDVLGEVLIPAGLLVNGSTIVQVATDEVTYWHVELDGHDIILADNLPAESYLDMGNRAFFDDAQAVDPAAGPDADLARRTHADFCRPFHVAGPVVTGIKIALRNRAVQLGWTLTRSLDLYLEVDGQRVDPVVRGLTARFHVPAGAGDLTMVSPASRPCDALDTEDSRRLGVCFEGLAIDDGFGAEHPIAVDDPRLVAGLHDVEDGCRRWTAGRTPLPADFTTAHRDGFYLRIELAGPMTPRWVAPAASAASAERPRLSIVV